jgi:hypothetical protein
MPGPHRMKPRPPSKLLGQTGLPGRELHYLRFGRRRPVRTHRDTRGCQIISVGLGPTDDYGKMAHSGYCR